MHLAVAAFDDARSSAVAAKRLVEAPRRLVAGEDPEAGRGVATAGQRAQQRGQERPSEAAALDAVEEIDRAHFALRAEPRVARLARGAETHDLGPGLDDLHHGRLAGIEDRRPHAGVALD